MGTDADDYHGELIADPYRWLERTADPATTAWIAAQNDLTESVLSRCAERSAIRQRLTELADYPRYGVPFERGGRWFQFRNSGLQDQPVLYLMSAPDDQGRPLLDPNQLSADGTLAIEAAEVTSDGSLLAYSTKSAGSDWQTWHVRDVATGTDLPDTIEWSKFSGAAWRKDGAGFYYAAPDRPASGTEYLAEHGVQRIWYHRIGSASEDDKLVFATPDQPGWLPTAQVSDDGRFLVISVTVGTAPQASLYVLDLTDPAAQLRAVVADFENTTDFVTSVGATLYLMTDYRAERHRLVAVDLHRPGRQFWREIVAQARDTLIGATFAGGRLVCHYLRDAHSVLGVHELDGTLVRHIELPGFASVADGCGGDQPVRGRPDGDLVHFGVTSFTESGSVWSHRLSTGETRELWPSGARCDSGGMKTEQVLIPSADGTSVPVFVVHRRDVSATGDVPVLLYGYGGFNIPVTPVFSVLFAAWVESGGLLVVANLRGGGEYGRSWHEAGRLGAKQNVFDDFCACARWLVSSGWSRPDRIAILGRSNGGLLVGACMTQHPELFGACLAGVGVLDMLRFHQFTIGRAWIADYGDPANPDQYRWLRDYSPLHNLRAGTEYPATLLLTGDHDDRVVPGHSFKFAAALQAAQGGDAPVLIRIDTSAGHGGGAPTRKIIAESADMLAFLRIALGLTSPNGYARHPSGTALPGWQL
jgi:prolyl oligopeptidase